MPTFVNGTSSLSATNLNLIDGAGMAISVAANDAPTIIKERADYVCDGTADEVQINAAIVVVATAGGGVVLSGGTFNCSTPVIIDADYVSLRGQGPTATTVKAASGFTGSEIIRFGKTSPVRPSGRCLLANMRVFGNAVGTQGTMDGVLFKVYQGLMFNVQVQGCNNFGIRVRGSTAGETGSTAWSSYGTEVWGCKAFENGFGGLYMDNAAGTDSRIVGGEYFRNAGPGIRVGTVISGITDVFAWGNRNNADGTTKGRGIQLEATSRMSLRGCKIEQNRGGIDLIAASSILISGCTFASNSCANLPGAGIDGFSALPAGWYLIGAQNEEDDIGFNGSGGSATNVHITGCVFADTYTPDTSRWHIRNASGHNVIIRDNIFPTGQAGTGVISDMGQANTWVIEGNQQFPTETRGIATIPNGSTSVTVNHGLMRIPDTEDFRLTVNNAPASLPTDDFGYMYVGVITATEVTFHSQLDPGVNGLVIGWEVAQGRIS